MTKDAQRAWTAAEIVEFRKMRDSIYECFSGPQIVLDLSRLYEVLTRFYEDTFIKGMQAQVQSDVERMVGLKADRVGRATGENK